MSKADWVWLAIRVFGLYVLVRAAISVAKILHAGMAYVSPLGWSDEWAGYFQSALLEGITSSVIYGAIGAYLVCGGSWLHKLLMRTGPSGAATR